MESIQIAVMMGSQSDWPTMEESVKILREFGVECEVKILSAHRTPRETAAYAEELMTRGVQVVICVAGGSASLAGVVAAHTSLPVIGVPIESVLQGMDSLLSTVQMPPGVPVGGVAIGKPGAQNAALLALRILALHRPDIRQKLLDFQERQKQKILQQKVDF